METLEKIESRAPRWVSAKDLLRDSAILSLLLSPSEHARAKALSMRLLRYAREGLVQRRRRQGQRRTYVIVLRERARTGWYTYGRHSGF